MTQLMAVQLPHDLLSWSGTAAELAALLNERLLAHAGLPDEAGSATERLIRYYVTEGLLSEPAVDGRERKFGPRQVTQFIVLRRLQQDGWPLAKIREMLLAVGDQLPAADAVAPPAPTAAQLAVERIRGRSIPATAAAAPAAERSGAIAAFSLSAPPPAAPVTALAQAAGVTGRRTQLAADLKGLGNPAGKAQRRRVVRLELAPWCEVLIDAAQLASLDATAPRALGDILTRALEEERLTQGNPP
jgi:DNA-binding transcriptional MerR regulator